MRKHRIALQFVLAATVLLGGLSASAANGFNAVKISLRNGTNHYIAIDGKNLEMSTAGRTITLGNSGITVAYDTDEVAGFVPGNYQFGTGEFYVGNKPDMTSVESITDSVLAIRLDGGIIEVSGNGNKSAGVVIFNLDGISVASGSLASGSASFDTSSFAPGTYILRVGTKSYKILLGR